MIRFAYRFMFKHVLFVPVCTLLSPSQHSDVLPQDSVDHIKMSLGFPLSEKPGPLMY